MCEVTATEFKKHFGKYIEIASKERVSIFHRGKKIATLIPEKEMLLKRIDSYFGILPPEAATDDDIDRE